MILKLLLNPKSIVVLLVLSIPLSGIGLSSTNSNTHNSRLSLNSAVSPCLFDPQIFTDEDPSDHIVPTFTEYENILPCYTCGSGEPIYKYDKCGQLVSMTIPRGQHESWVTERLCFASGDPYDNVSCTQQIYAGDNLGSPEMYNCEDEVEYYSVDVCPGDE